MSSQTGVVVADLSPEWFDEAQRSIAALRNRLEQTEREIARREYELELRERVLEERERLSEAGMSGPPPNQDFEAKMRTLEERARQVGQQREALVKESAAFAARRKETQAMQEALNARERSLLELERGLSEREAALDMSRRELEAARVGVIEENGPTMEALDGAQALPSGRLDDTVRHMLDLRQAMETATSSVSARESQALAVLANAAARARDVEVLEGKIRDEETRLAALKMEIVNAKKALMAVDSAITKMPSDVVDEFVQSEDFQNYEHAVKAFRRFAD